MILELKVRLPCEVTSETLPKGVTSKDRRGDCLAWWVTEESHHWLICFYETGELVWVPMKEILLVHNWSDGHRYGRPQ